MEHDKKRVMKALFALLVVATLFGVVGTIKVIGAGGDRIAEATISVSGTGEVTAIPDVATFTFSVMEEAKDVATAQTAAAEKTNAILAFLEDEGIEDADIKTTGYNVYPRYDYVQREIQCITYPCVQPGGEQVLRGYQVTQSVTVTVRETDEAGTLLSGVGSRGATNVSGLSFTIDDEDALVREARQKAINDAKEKAERLADDLDVRLVRIVSFNESGGDYYPRYDYAYAEDAMATKAGGVSPEIPVGENTITRTVHIVYEIR